MKTSILLIFTFLVFALSLSAQTKLISHKSHSGNLENFSKALDDNLFDLASSNFGAAPMPEITHAILDSVIYISPTIAIMVTRKADPKQKQQVHWKEGRDTLINHWLFSQQHQLDKIKRFLTNEYFFANPIDKVVFIGYDNGKIEPPAPTSQPVQTPQDVPENIVEPEVTPISETHTVTPEPKVETSPKKEIKKKKKLFFKKKKRKEKKKGTTPMANVNAQTPNSNLPFSLFLLGGFAIMMGFLSWKKTKTT